MEMQGYNAEYFEVISEMSRICSIISNNNKLEEKKEKLLIK